MRVLELGSYIAPAYAGMILAEQGCTVVKWARTDDPTLDLDGGRDLWEWLNHGKLLTTRVLKELPAALAAERPDVVIDNVRPEALERAAIDPEQLAEQHLITWVSIRADVAGAPSFDVVAQARSWMEYGPWMPLYLGDTCVGLWAAFKAMAMRAQLRHGHYVIPQAASLQKLVEGELILDPPRDGKRIPWDRDTYTAEDGHAIVDYRGELVVEPVRDRAWKLKHLRHDGTGRIVI